MKRRRSAAGAAVAAVVAVTPLVGVLTLALAAAGCRGGPAADPLAADVHRWSAMLRLKAASDRRWVQIEGAARPGLDGVEAALRHGHRLLALERLAEVRVAIATMAYVQRRPARELGSGSALAAEWARMSGPLADDLGKPVPGALSGVRPAAARAIGEAALPQVRAYYRSSLDYGRSTTPQEGFYYLGIAQAQAQLVAFCRTLAASFPDRRQPELPLLAADLDELQGGVLAAFRPPASILRHGDFIVTGSLIKEARELDAAGLRFGALLRYLQATLAVQRLRPDGPPADGRALAGRLREAEARLGQGNLDHSIGRLFLEMAQESLAGGVADPAGAAAAAAILDMVLPRYFAALGPAPRAAPRAAPVVTITLVRWPYT